MHRVVSTVIATAALIAGGLVGATTASAAADSAPQRPSAADPAPAGSYTALTPKRVLDTRAGAPVAAGAATTLTLRSASGPLFDGAAVAVLNVTVVTPSASGYLSVYPGPTRPTVSNLNFRAGQTIANLVTVPISSDGTVQIYNGSGGDVDVLADLTGSFTAPDDPRQPASTPGAFNARGPQRVFDGRSLAVPAQGTLRVAITTNTAPQAGAALLNATVVTPGAAGYLTVFPGGTRPTASNLNFATGQTVAVLVAARLSGGYVTLYNASSRPLAVLLDLAGYFVGTTSTQSNLFSFVPPARVLDTRSGTGSVRSPLAAGQSRVLTVDGHGGVPTSGVSAVVLAVAVTNTTASGYLTVYPGGTRPTASTLNFAAKQTVPNLVVVPVLNGTVSLYNGSGRPIDVLADVSGYVRSSDVVVPNFSNSHYIRNSVAASDSTTKIRSTLAAIGAADADNVPNGNDDHQVALLQFGAQTKVGTAGPNGGVRLSGTETRITYAQVVAAVDGYVSGYAGARGPGASYPVTVAVGTSSSGFAGSTYSPTDKGRDWADKVVEPAVADASGSGVTVVGADDIEANFDAEITEVKTWIGAYLAAGPNPLINNGAAVQCPSTLGQISTSCGPVQVDRESPTDPVVVHTWKQDDYQLISGGIAPTRISVLPQIYSPDAAVQWENISLTGTAARRPALTFAGVLTSFNACFPSGSGCTSIAPQDGWIAMRQALDSNVATAATVLPADTDLIVN